MIRISLPWILDVIGAIDRLDTVVSGKLSAHAYTLFFADFQLENLYDQSVYKGHLRASRQKARELQEHISTLFKKWQNDNEAEIFDGEVWSLRTLRDTFKTVFLADLNIMPAYLVTGKEGYDINMLIDFGITLFPLDLAKKVPEASLDAAEVGKALAFEVATGCGFHTFRVVESVMKRYWDEVSKGSPRPSLMTLGNVAAELEKYKFGEPKIYESMKQMARLHRNPVIHPEVILSVEEAIGIIGIARSIIGAMLAVLPEVPLTTSTPGAATP